MCEFLWSDEKHQRENILSSRTLHNSRHLTLPSTPNTLLSQISPPQSPAVTRSPESQGKDASTPLMRR